MLMINSAFILGKSDNCSVNLFSNRRNNSTNVLTINDQLSVYIDNMCATCKTQHMLASTHRDEINFSSRKEGLMLYHIMYH